LNAIKSALHLRKIDIDPKFCIEAPSGDRREGGQVAQSLLKASEGDELPTAWICFNGVMARGVVGHLSSEGLRVAEDISVVAFDGTRVCEEEHPTLTAASTSPELMGRVAAELLLQIENSEQNRFVDSVLAAELNCRESTGPVHPSPSRRNGAAVAPLK
jgi:LacI family transcriptional regulator